MTSISRAGPDPNDAAGASSVASLLEEVRAVADEAVREDGRSPLNEATLLSLRHDGLAGKALWVARDPGGSLTGFALVAEAGGEAEANLVVAPAARRAGVGRALAQQALEAYADVPVTAWSHGNHPAAARLATALGFERVRDLWVMRRPLSPEHPLPPVEPAGGTVVRTFRPGQDEDAFLALNAEAFVDHPEQGSMTRADLEARMAEPWFDP
ncbi:MAG TPA: mycothiol synthase, partial [Nocardioidaceae bacterium]